MVQIFMINGGLLWLTLYTDFPWSVLFHGWEAGSMIHIQKTYLYSYLIDINSLPLRKATTEYFQLTIIIPLI